MRPGATLAVCIGFAVIFALPSSLSAQAPALFASTATADRVLRRADIVPLELLSLEDLLREQAGIAVLRRGGMGTPEFVQVAGSGNGRVQLVVDGVEVLQPEQEWPRLYAVQLAMVDSIAFWRTTDPARIAIWTRQSDSPAPAADLDLGRGTLGSRTRRAQLFTPQRAVTVTAAYDELLREGDEFRTEPLLDEVFDLGAYDNRTLLARIELRRGDERVRVEHFELQDNSHGSFAAARDRTATRAGRDGLRFETSLGTGRLGLDVGHQAWQHDRQSEGLLEYVREARTTAALDVELPRRGAWTNAVRLRHVATSGDRFAGPDTTRSTRTRQDLQLEATRDGTLRGSVWAGGHHQEGEELEWSGGARAALGGPVWAVAARLGRGVAFAGWGEANPYVARTSVHGAVEVARRGQRTTVQLTAFGKSFDGGQSSQNFFPALRNGPSRIGGLLAETSWRSASVAWHGNAASTFAWFPTLRGDPSGLPSFQARFDLRGGRRMFGGDLVLDVLSTWRLDTRREFAGGVGIAPSAAGDVTLNAQLLRRADLFFGFRNVTDALIETYPGVLLTGRLTWFGIRVRFFD